MDNTPEFDEELFEPFSPFSPLLTEKEAQHTSDARSLWLEFSGEVLPESIVIDNGLLNGSLKHGSQYTVVTVPYTLYMVSYFQPIAIRE